MDNLPNNQPSQPQVQFNQKSFFQSFWGKLTIFLALVILLLTATVALNYFNIVPLSQKFPFLSSLPTKQIQTIKQNNTIPQTSSLEISLETAARKTILTTLRKILNPSLNASFDTIQITQDKKTKVDFSGVLDTKNGPASLITAVSPNGQSLTSINFSLANSSDVTPSISFAQANTASVFTTQPKGTWGCQPLYEYQYCENFWEDNGVKQGLGLYGPVTVNDQKKLTFFFCQFDQKSTNYEWKSCTTEFAKTGVK